VFCFAAYHVCELCIGMVWTFSAALDSVDKNSPPCHRGMFYYALTVSFFTAAGMVIFLIYCAIGLIFS